MGGEGLAGHLRGLSSARVEPHGRGTAGGAAGGVCSWRWRAERWGSVWRRGGAGGPASHRRAIPLYRQGSAWLSTLCHPEHLQVTGSSVRRRHMQRVTCSPPCGSSCGSRPLGRYIHRRKRHPGAFETYSGDGFRWRRVPRHSLRWGICSGSCFVAGMVQSKFLFHVRICTCCCKFCPPNGGFGRSNAHGLPGLRPWRQPGRYRSHHRVPT